MEWRQHPKSSSVEEILKHQLLSERRFFGEFLGSPEPPAAEVLPAGRTIDEDAARLVQLAAARLAWMSALRGEDWLRSTKFFVVERERIWGLWRRVRHSAHHRTQLTGYLRLLDRAGPATYGP